MKQRFIPSMQMSELMKPLGTAFNEYEVFARAMEYGFYEAVETRVIADEARARAFRRLCEENGIHWMAWGSSAVYAEGLMLGCSDASWRRHSIDRLAELMDRAAQQGANAFGMLSGVRPEDDAELSDAILRAADSMQNLAEKASQYGAFRLLIEPLDRDVHKRGLIGTAAEAASVIRAARAAHEHVYMVWDSAHMKLQEGDLAASLRDAGDTVGHIHLCNAVLNSANPLYGDHHPMPGVEDGYLNEAAAAEILRNAALLDTKLPCIPVAVEARPESDPWGAEALVRALLAAALKASAQ